MINNTIEQLRVMKMSAMASELERQLEDPESYSQVSLNYTVSKTRLERKAIHSLIWRFSII